MGFVFQEGSHSYGNRMSPQVIPFVRIPYALSWPAMMVMIVITRSWAPAQTLEAPVQDRPREISALEFRGDSSIPGSTLRDIVQSRESPGGFSKFLYRTFGEKLGSKPEYFDEQTFSEDKVRLRRFYEEKGFYDAVVEGSAAADSGDGTVRIMFTVRENRRSLIDSIGYRGLTGVPASLSTKIFNEPAVRRGMPYEQAAAVAEIRRVLDLCVNNGYPSARKDDEHSAAIRRLSTGNFTLIFAFLPGRQYRFGAATVTVDPPREDLTPNLALRQLDFQPGELYSEEKRLSSERNLNRLGLYESARIDHLPLTDSTAPEVLPMDIFARPKPRNELAPELIVSDENNEFNLGLGLGFTNRNFFGDGRLFTARSSVRTQKIFGGLDVRDTTVVGAAELQFQILQPYLFTRTLSGSWTSTISAEKQKPYILSILRNKIGLSNQFAVYTTGFFDWTLERESPEILVKAPVSDSVPRQFNSIFTVTLQRDRTNDIFSPTDGFFNSISLEESGVLPKILPGIRSGLPFTQYYKITLFGRWYRDLTTSRFNILALKLRTGYQDKYGESRLSNVSIPLNRRFFAGGSGSVRGWGARELGAMANDLIQFGGNFILEGSAEMRVNQFRGFGKLGFVRFDNIWMVYFFDFGNIWSDITDFKPRDVGMAAGLGFRYETFFGPFRIDYGFRLYDPKADVGRQTIFKKKLFDETLRSGVFHFGIGHAF